MKLTKSQRHTAYIIMLAEAEGNPIINTFPFGGDIYRELYSAGLCHLIYFLFQITSKGDESSIIKVIDHFFPELFRKKYKAESGYDWPPKTEKGWERRIQFLNECIEETYTAVK